MPKKKVTEAVEEVVQEPVVSEPVPPQAPRRQGSDDLLELNDLERGVTREDSEDAKWGYLAGAARRQQIPDRHRQQRHYSDREWSSCLPG